MIDIINASPCAGVMVAVISRDISSDNVKVAEDMSAGQMGRN